MNSSLYSTNMGDVATKLMLSHELMHVYLNVLGIEAKYHHRLMVHDSNHSKMFMDWIMAMIPGMGGDFYYQAIRGGTHGDRGGDTSGEKGAKDFANEYGLP